MMGKCLGLILFSIKGTTSNYKMFNRKYKDLYLALALRFHGYKRNQTIYTHTLKDLLPSYTAHNRTQDTLRLNNVPLGIL